MPTVAGSLISGERIVVGPPSMSYEFADDPAAAPVTSAFDPDRTVPAWYVVVEGLARCQAPALIVSVPSGSAFQPREISKSSLYAPQWVVRLPTSAYRQPACSIR